jgi:hypothetical protein
MQCGQTINTVEVSHGSTWLKSRGLCLRFLAGPFVVETRPYFIQYCFVSTPRSRPKPAAQRRAGLEPQAAESVIDQQYPARKAGRKEKSNSRILPQMKMMNTDKTTEQIQRECPLFTDFGFAFICVHLIFYLWRYSLWICIQAGLSPGGAIPHYRREPMVAGARPRDERRVALLCRDCLARWRRRAILTCSFGFFMPGRDSYKSIV